MQLWERRVLSVFPKRAIGYGLSVMRRLQQRNRFEQNLVYLQLDNDSNFSGIMTSHQSFGNHRESKHPPCIVLRIDREG